MLRTTLWGLFFSLLQLGIASMPPGEQWTQETGVIHGGLVATLADTAAVYALRPGLPSGHIMLFEARRSPRSRQGRMTNQGNFVESKVM